MYHLCIKRKGIPSKAKFAHWCFMPRFTRGFPFAPVGGTKLPCPFEAAAGITKLVHCPSGRYMVCPVDT